MPTPYESGYSNGTLSGEEIEQSPQYSFTPLPARGIGNGFGSDGYGDALSLSEVAFLQREAEVSGIELPDDVNSYMRAYFDDQQWQQ